MKFKNIGLFFVLVVVFLSQKTIFAQNPTDLELFQTQGSRIDEFFKILDEKSDSRDAFSYLFANSPIMVKNQQNFQEMLDKLVESTSKLRTISPVWVPEQFDAQKIGRDIVIMRYLYKGDTIPVVWYITFYRPPSKITSESSLTPPTWHCIGVRFDTNLEPLLNNNGERHKF